MDINKQDIIDAAIELDRMERQAAYLEIQPHWQTWADREEISLAEAVFLAMSIDPALYNSSTGRIKLGHKFLFRDGDSIKHAFDTLHETARRAVENSPPKLPYVRYRGYDWIVKNYEFAKWWKSIGRELPAEFPNSNPLEPVQLVTPNQDITKAISKAKSERTKKMLKSAQAFHDDNGRYPEGSELFNMGKDAHGYDEWETFRKTFIRYFSEAG